MDPDFYKNFDKRAVKKIEKPKIEELIIDEELKNIDQENLLSITRSLICSIWEVFFDGNIDKIKEIVSSDIYQNISAKVKICENRPKLVEISSIRIKSMTKDDTNFFALFHVITEIRENEKTIFNIEDWSITTEKNEINWTVDYTSAF